MNSDINYNRAPRNNKSIAGIFLVILGGIYLFRQFDFFFFPNWFFSWPMILIIIGIFSGIKHNFQRGGWFIMILIGSIFLLKNIFFINFFFAWPVVLIAIGIYLILKRDDSHYYRECWGRRMDSYRGRYHGTDEPSL